MSTELEDADPNDSRVTFVKPPLTFKGTELNPYSLGYKILWFQLVDLKVENYSWLVFTLIFLLYLPRKQARALAFDKEKFRNACLDWIDTMQDEDILIATDLFTKITEQAEATRVDVIEDEGTDEKKD